ncbi:YjcZ family sporulation protein [Bacillus sp. V5-8f]|nr:YjcZ family sporulation protein [Bacillus sp. V5-8f]PLT33746.1 sporulation protein YjcZ [Bacillus sp. V5-8f]
MFWCGCGPRYTAPVEEAPVAPATGFSFAFILVLFILLVIIGCVCYTF